MTTNNTNQIPQTIRRCFSAWETNDRAALEPLLADDFTFSSPNDDHLNKQEYWEICWPGCVKIKSIDIEKLFQQANEAFVRYVGQLVDGTRFRNVEHFTFDGDRIKAVDVYFGRNLSPAGE